MITVLARRLRSWLSACCVALLSIGLLAALPGGTANAAVPTGFVLRSQPSGQAAFDLTDFAYLPDGSVLTTGKKGTVAWAAADGRTRTIAALPVEPAQDLGLTGLAVAADYATSRHVYLARSVPGGTGGYLLRLARWTVTGAPEPTGLADEQVLFEFRSPYAVHGMTGIVAADDGTLWVSIGDLSDFTRTDRNALRTMDLDTPNGKILHVTATGDGVAGNPYYQASNPSSWRSRVYASGFRSPFRLSLDPGTGTPIVGDVGYNTWEEIDLVRPGQNYKWPCWEGNHRTPGYADLPECASEVNTPPLWEYHHGGGVDQGNSVTGGIIYRGESYPEAYRGAYFFGDYTTKKLWTLRFDAQGKLVRAPENPPFAGDIGGPVKFAAAPNGDVVFADIYSGTLRRLSYPQGNSAPVAEAEISTDPATRTVTFDGSRSQDFDGDPLTYAWDFGDGATGSGARTSHTYPDGDRFTARLTVTDPLGASGSVDLLIAPANHSPQLALTTPGAQTFAVGETVSLTARATDAEDGTTPISWTSAEVHCPEEATCHRHPGVGGTGESFQVAFTDHPDSRMEITATTTDSAGVRSSETYAAMPREHLLTLTSNVPAVLQIPAEGGRSSAMVTEGATFDVIAAATATDGVATFAGWTDGVGDRSRVLTMGAGDLTLAARYATPIDRRYEAEPQLRNLLGQPTGPEIAEDGIRYRSYERGRLYWTAQTGVHYVYGGNLAKYLQLGGHGMFGPPTTDELSTPDGVGRYNHFVGATAGFPASIYWSPDTGSHAVWGAIRQSWAANGWEQGPLGYPTTDEVTTPDGVGRYNHFSKAGSVYWSPGTGAHAIWGAIRVTWSQLGWELGPLGYPATDELITPDGVGHYNHFSKAASIYWTPGTGAHEVYGRIRERWSALGWERSYLGYPKTGEFAVSGGRRNDFEHGYVEWRAATDTTIDRRY
ncbi:PQQ-dependent sugar dehydrogenase [Saccharopolyspora shandongensis]|uniref:PQQ-dependent sugar dehydrogenase n=1 Tax=Saccharopolyspora shandongensis TaxID=418495 RepID=UPI00343C07AC